MESLLTEQSRSGALRSGEDSDAPLRDVLEQLCISLELPAQDHAHVLDTRVFVLGNAVMTLAFEAWSSFIKIYVNIGRPVDADAPKLHRYLLMRQILQPAPFMFTAGVHPDTDEVFLCGAVPLPKGDEAMEDFAGFLKGLALVRDALHEEMPKDVAWA
jgi:hypothetical protein